MEQNNSRNANTQASKTSASSLKHAHFASNESKIKTPALSLPSEGLCNEITPEPRRRLNDKSSKTIDVDSIASASTATNRQGDGGKYDWSAETAEAESSFPTWLDLASDSGGRNYFHCNLFRPRSFYHADSVPFEHNTFRNTHWREGQRKPTLAVETKISRNKTFTTLLIGNWFSLMVLLQVFLSCLIFIVFDEFAAGTCWGTKTSKFEARQYSQEMLATTPRLQQSTLFSSSGSISHKTIQCSKQSRFYKPLTLCPLVHRLMFPFIRFGESIEQQSKVAMSPLNILSHFLQPFNSFYEFLEKFSLVSLLRKTKLYVNSHDPLLPRSKINTMQCLNNEIIRIFKSNKIDNALKHSAATLELQNHTIEFRKRIEHVAHNVYVGIGYGLANVVLIDTPRGLIVFDTLENPKAMRLLMNDWTFINEKKESSKECSNNYETSNYRNTTQSSDSARPKVLGIFYSHFHADHVFGGSEIVNHDTQVWAHQETATLINKVFSVIGGVTYKRSMRQFGSLLSIKEGYINAGIGSRLHYTAKDTGSFLAVAQPTHVWSGERKVVKMGGELLELIFAPGESKDQTIIWMPEKRILFAADNLYKSLPNIYAIRGTESRDAMQWARSLDLMRFLKPDYLVLGHTGPVKGQALIWDIITAYRDAIQYIHDQTVRQMNKGHSIDDIVKIVKLPSQLEHHPYLRPFYGTVPWAVRAVYQHYVGWFSGLPEHLETLGTIERAQRMSELVGGREFLLRHSLKAFEQNDFQWSLELASHASRLDPKCYLSKQLRIFAMRSLAANQTSAPGRNWFLTAAKELEDEIIKELGVAKKEDLFLFYENSKKYRLLNNFNTEQWRERLWGTCKKSADRSNINDQLKLSPAQRRQCIRSVKSAVDSFSFIPVRIKAEESEKIDLAVYFVFTDTHESVCLHFRRGIAYVNPTCDRKKDIEVITTDKIWRDIMMGEITPVAAVTLGRLKVTGMDPRNYLRLQRVLSLIEVEME